MKFLHTSDWHIGKTLKGRDRLEEQKHVLREVTKIAVDNDVDAVLIAGDLYDNAVPTAAAVTVAVQALTSLANRGIEVVLIAGNHDHGASLEAYRPLMEAARIHVYGHARSAAKGGVHTFTAKSTGETVNVAVLPFLSQRYAVRAAEIVNNTPSQNVGTYDQWIRDILTDLKSGFTPDAVNLVMCHLTCTDAKFGGGERTAQSIMEYHVPAAIFPIEANYVALGHLHRRQQVPAGPPVHYSGAPFAVDFGEEDNTSVVVVVETAPGVPAKTTDVEVTSGRKLRTVAGTVANLIAGAASYGDDYLRLIVDEPVQADTRDLLISTLPNALEIRIADEHRKHGSGPDPRTDRVRRTPEELFKEFCSTQAIDDPRVVKMFNQLLDDITSPAGQA